MAAALGERPAVAKGEQTFGSFIKVARDGKVTVAVPQVETGQGIWTALAQIVADELGVAWETVAVEPAPLTKAYANPLAEERGLAKGHPDHRELDLGPRVRAAAARGGSDRSRHAGRCGRRSLERGSGQLRYG